MATDKYIRPQGGDWFDAANWNAGAVPAPGDIVDLFQSADSGPGNSAHTGVDATAGTPSGVTIDLSGTSGTAVSQPFAPNLTAGYMLGTPTAPVTIDVTADSGTASQAGVLLHNLYGSIDVEPNQSLSVTGDLVTINGPVTIGAGALLAFDYIGSGVFAVGVR